MGLHEPGEPEAGQNVARNEVKKVMVNMISSRSELCSLNRGKYNDRLVFIRWHREALSSMRRE